MSRFNLITLVLLGLTLAQNPSFLAENTPYQLSGEQVYEFFVSYFKGMEIYNNLPHELACKNTTDFENITEEVKADLEAIMIAVDDLKNPKNIVQSVQNIYYRSIDVYRTLTNADGACGQYLGEMSKVRAFSLNHIVRPKQLFLGIPIHALWNIRGIWNLNAEIYYDLFPRVKNIKAGGYALGKLVRLVYLWNFHQPHF
jgi:hypothetical protein